jgi:hypothetical protein
MRRRCSQPEQEVSTIGFPMSLIDLAGFIALLLWGTHMVQTGVQRAFGASVVGHFGVRLRIEQFQWFGVRLNAQACPFNVRFLLAMGI